MLVKIHKSYREIVAICDAELLGKKFEQDIRQLDLTTKFFDGDKKTEQEVLEIMQNAKIEDATFNIVGKKSIELALKAEIITKEGIITIQGIPIALVLL